MSNKKTTKTVYIQVIMILFFNKSHYRHIQKYQILLGSIFNTTKTSFSTQTLFLTRANASSASLLNRCGLVVYLNSKNTNMKQDIDHYSQN